MKKEIIRCEYNMDTCCVELQCSDGTLIAINCEFRANGARVPEERRAHSETNGAKRR